MNLNTILVCSLASFCCLSLFISSVSAQPACTPVVFAFRHAEDKKKERGLTPAGVEHADLYVGMVDEFTLGRNYCPVGYVYSTYDTKTNGDPGTINPFQTAAPLAHQACITRAFLTGSRTPDDPCRDPSADFLPHMKLLNGNRLYEYLGTTDAEKATEKSATTAQLRAELVSNASEPLITGSELLSSAIFWTSQGLHTLGTAIADDTDIPKKDDPVLGTPPRNAVYVFEFNAGAFKPPTNVTQYLQCFNFNVDRPTNSPSGVNYYCRKHPGDIPDITGDLTPLRGKICDTIGLPVARNDLNGEEGYYFLGPC